MKILTTILDIGAAFLRLAEAEGRMLRRAVMNTAWALACVGVATLLILAGAGFFLAGVYQYLAAETSPAAASFLLSLLAILLALAFAGIAKWRCADSE